MFLFRKSKQPEVEPEVEETWEWPLGEPTVEPAVEPEPPRATNPMATTANNAIRPPAIAR